ATTSTNCPCTSRRGRKPRARRSSGATASALYRCCSASASATKRTNTNALNPLRWLRGQRPYRHHALTNAAGQHRINHARHRDEHSIPEHDLAGGGHGCSKQQTVGQRCGHADRIEVEGLDKLKHGRGNGQERRLAVAAEVADGFVELAVEALVGWCQDDDVTALAQAGRASLELGDVVLDVFEHVDV